MTKRLPAVERRRLLLEGAKDLFAQGGIPGLTTAALARKCGVTEPILYRHFPSKSALLRQVMRDVVERVSHELNLLAERETDPIQALRSVVGRYPALSIENAREFSIINRALAEIQDEETRRLLKDHYENYLTVLEKIIVEGQRKGMLRSDIPPETGAWHLIHAALGYLFTRPLRARGQDDRLYVAGLTEAAISGLLA